MEKNVFTISVYTENNIGLLNRISAIFLKRHINLESFSTSESEIPNVFRFVIVVKTDTERVRKIVQQIGYLSIQFSLHFSSQFDLHFDQEI